MVRPGEVDADFEPNPVGPVRGYVPCLPRSFATGVVLRRGFSSVSSAGHGPIKFDMIAE